MKGRNLLLIALIFISISLASCTGQEGTVSVRLKIDVSAAWMNEEENTGLLVLVIVDDAPAPCVKVEGEGALLEENLSLYPSSSVVDVYLIVPGESANRTEEPVAEVTAKATLTSSGGDETERNKSFALGRGSAGHMQFDMTSGKKTGGRSVSMLKKQSDDSKEKVLSDVIDIIIRKPAETDPVISHFVKSDNSASFLTRIIE